MKAANRESNADSSCDNISGMEKITRDMLIHKVMKSDPETLKVFEAHKMGCKSCGGGKVETVAWGASMHGLDVESFLKKLNEAADEGRSAKK
jgi:hybrid cluster-associated redox disulfide protein